MLSPLHFWAVYFGIGILFIFLAYWGGRWRRLNPKEVEQGDGPAGCAHCGYDVRGLPSHICPECGSDLNEVGRLAPRFRKWQKVPPVLRAVVFTAAVAICAMLLIVLSVGVRIGPFGSILPVYVPTTQTTQDRFAGSHRLVDAAGNPLRVTALREQIRRRRPLAGEDQPAWLEVSHTGTARLYFGMGPRNWPDDHLRFETDLLAGRWKAVDGLSGETVESGEGVPTVEAVHRLANDFAQARATGYGIQTQMAIGPNGTLVPTSTLPPGSFTGEFTDTGTVSLLQAALVVQVLDLPRRDAKPEIQAIFERSDAGSWWMGRYGGSGTTESVDWHSWLWLIGFWVLVLGSGLWFVTRRRDIRPAGSRGKADDPQLRFAQPSASGASGE